MTDEVKEITKNDEQTSSAVWHLTKAREWLEEIPKSIEELSVSEGTDRKELLAKLRDYLSSADRAQYNLDEASKCIEEVEWGRTWLKLVKEYKRLSRTTKTVLSKLNSAIGNTHILGLDNQKVIDDLSRIFNPSIERDRKVAKNRAIEAEARAKEAETRAKEAEQKAIEATARQKEAEALKEAKQLEAEAIAEQSRKANLELLDSIRAKDAQIVVQARETIDVAVQAMDRAIKADDIQKVKEQVEIIQHESQKVATISGMSVLTGNGKHKMFDSVYKDIKQNISPMLVGPAGSGKSTVLQQVADYMNLKYYPLSVNGQTSEYQIIGYKNANGEYIRSAFREAFENGGLFSFEEIDAGNPNVLTVMNNALSQDFYLFPDCCVKKHRDFRLAASANTYGRGANRQYIGRNPLDAATLDRFAMTYIDYDENLELKIGPEPKWTDYVQTIRHVIESFGMPIIVSTRAVIFGGMDVKSGTQWDVALDKFVWRGCNPEDVEKVMNKVKQLQQSQKTEQCR